MGVATTVSKYLARMNVSFDLIEHAHTPTSQHTAEAARVPGDEVAKAVLLRDKRGYVMAVLPATHRVDTHLLCGMLHRDLKLVDESEFGRVFTDCEPGAIPPLGEAYGIATVVDDDLLECADLYLEAGDHEHLLHLSRDQFRSLMAHVMHGAFSYHA